MIRYEGLFLTTPQITQDEAKNLELSLDTIVKKHKGSIVSFERWGKYRLAYPVRKNEYGNYFLMRFDIPEATDALNDIKQLFIVKLHTFVMREMFTRLDADQALAYQRSKSLEESPTRDVESFLKENKMTGLLPSVDEKKASVAKKEVETSEEPAQEATETVSE